MVSRIHERALYVPFIIFYAPIIVLAFYSFNNSRPEAWTVFTKWYLALFQDRT